MKRIFFITIFAMSAMHAWAQLDTLECGMREPTFYYWDTNWFDHYALNYTQNNPRIWWNTGGMTIGSCQPEYARYCYTDSALSIIGVAGCVLIIPERLHFEGNPYDYLHDE